MTEVPDYLLQRSRERRAALGLDTGGDAGAASPAPVPVESAAPAAAAAAVPATTEPGGGEIEKVEPPAPVAPWVEAANNRKKVPVWMAPVAIFIPLWAFMVFGTLEEPTREAEGPIAAGGEVYANCASCHGAGGGGGTGYPLNDGEVIRTFPNVSDHVAWVVNGSPAAGVAYGNPDRPGGQRISGTFGGPMPNFQSLSPTEIMEVVLYERVTHGLQSEAELEAWLLWVETGEIESVDWSSGVLAPSVEQQFNEFLAGNAEAAEAQAEVLEMLAEG